MLGRQRWNKADGALDPGTRVIRAVSHSLATIRRCEPRVRAWTYLDERDSLERAERADAEPAGGLTGLTIGVKDLIDTIDMPTSYGSSIYEGHQPMADALIVKKLRDGGGFILGKTVTTEFAVMTPGPTTNPWRATHTPGGSSSGSAAAVACGMVDIAIGTQTYGSLIRPAGFCGVWAFKPSRGLVPVSGVKPLAPSFDQIGWFARSLDLVEAMHRCIVDAPTARRKISEARLGVLDLCDYVGLEPEVSASVARLCGAASDRGAAIVHLNLGTLLRDVATAHQTIASREIALSLRQEIEHHRTQISEPLWRFLSEGASVTEGQYEEAQAKLRVLQATVEEAVATVEVLLTPSTVGEAPFGLASTGDPIFCSPWTAFGSPTMNLPGSNGATGLPLGLQLVASPGNDELLLAWAHWLAPSLG